MLRLLLFGSPQIEVDSQIVPLRHTKPLGLLAYLALTRQAQHRDALLVLLWPEFDEASARNNLRRELSRLKTVLGAEVLVADRMQVRCNPDTPIWLDVAVFQEQIGLWKQHGHSSGTACAACAGALTTAVELYRNDFMAGFNLSDSPTFDEWQFFQREQLREQLAGALQTLIAWHVASGDYSTALAYARRWLALDSLHEPAQRELMRLYAWSGQHAAALRQYAECVRVLADELGAEPEAETTALYEAIKARRVPQPAHEKQAAQPEHAPVPTVITTIAATQATRSDRPRHNLPPQPTPFVGREQELVTIQRYLTARDARLITVVGPGGIGKTRFAIEAALHAIEAFDDGVVFVPLQGVATVDLLAAAIASAVGCHLSGLQPPNVQLGAFLQERELLLVLDDFEHLLGEQATDAGTAADILGGLLETASRLRLLVTSREGLKMREEWRYPLDGLEMPPGETVGNIEQYSAVRLFTAHARRVRPEFEPEHEREGVIRICRLVAGMPLALELVAAWTLMLPCVAIATEIERNLAFLASDTRNLPVRHRSMRAVFDRSWQLLSHAERTTLARLSVFRSGITREAAAEVANATLTLLAALVDKSLLQREQNGCFRMHELLRQYAEEQLAVDPDAIGQARQAHAGHFVALLRKQFAAITGAGQLHALAEIASEIDNIRLAWQWITGVSGGAVDIEAIDASYQVLAMFYELRSLNHEGLDALEGAVRGLRACPSSPARAANIAGLLVAQASLMLHLGQIAQAKAVLEESAALYATFDIPLPPGPTTDPLYWLGIVAHIEGNFAETARLGIEARRRSELAAHRGNLGPSWYLTTIAALTQGQFRAALFAAEQAYTAVQATQDRWSLGHCHHHLGNVAAELGAYDEARAHYQAAYAICEEFDHRVGMVKALTRIGRVALRQGKYAEAGTFYERALPLASDLGDRGELAEVMHGLGRIALALGDFATAGRNLVQALELALEIGWSLLLLRICITGAELLLLTGRPDLGISVLIIALRHPATDRAAGDRAQRLLLDAETTLEQASFADAAQRGQVLDLDAIVVRLRAALAIDSVGVTI